MEPQLRIAGCSKLIQRNPNDAVVYHNRGVAYGLAGDIDRAIADYTTVIEIDPRNATAYENRGRAYASKGDSENANADATKANELIAKSSKTSEQPARPSPKKPKKAKTAARLTKIALPAAVDGRGCGAMVESDDNSSLPELPYHGNGSNFLRSIGLRDKPAAFNTHEP